MTGSKLSHTNIVPPPVAAVAAAVAPPWCRRCHRRGAVAAFSLLPPLPSQHRHRCLLDAAAAATSLLPPLPSHRRCLPCRLRRGAAATAPPSTCIRLQRGWSCAPVKLSCTLSPHTPGSGGEDLAGGETNLAIGGVQCARVLGHWDEDRHTADGPHEKKEVRI